MFLCDACCGPFAAAVCFANCIRNGTAQDPEESLNVVAPEAQKAIIATVVLEGQTTQLYQEKSDVRPKQIFIRRL
eukprot:5827392-Amphidinium_carterae.1